MVFGVASWHGLQRGLAILAMLACLPWRPAHADKSTFRVYDAEQGLASLGGACIVQDHAGYIMVCTEHGIFTYDGRRFINLGPAQGLRQGGQVFDIALNADGRVAVGFAEEVMVSSGRSDDAHPPGSLQFQSVQHPGITFYDERPHRLAAWQDGFVRLAGDQVERVVLPPGGPPRLDSMGYDASEAALVKGAASAFTVHGKLWLAFDDARLCAAEPGAVKCYDESSGLHGGPWRNIAAGAGDQVLARSATSVATFDPASGRWTLAAVPNQGGRYVNYDAALALFRGPDGRLITQAEHGLAVLGTDGWRLLTVEEGAPPGTIVAALTDATGQFWFQILGRGLMRWIGYGEWETIGHADGLSEGIAWQTARPPGGSVWVSTDTGADEVVRRGASLAVARVLPGSSFAIAADTRGMLWRGLQDGLGMVDPATGATIRIAAPPVNAIVVCPGDIVWTATQFGLFRVDGRAGEKLRAVPQGAHRTQVAGVACDGLGGVFYLAGGRLRHRRPDTADVMVGGGWPVGSFEPVAIAIGHEGDLWIGGSGGLYRFTLSGDKAVAVQAIPAADTRTNAVSAVMVDHRGWVWAGTALGVSVFDGQRWVSVDADAGLISDDVDEGGLREDPDGSVWITTSQGVSHLLEPGWLLADRPLKAVVSSALLGGRPVTSGRLPFTRDALALQFGTPNYGAERSVVFRYNLAGVDDGQVESVTGLVRYPFVPPGRHLLIVVAYDELTHRASPPACLLIDVDYPWWRHWWAELVWLLSATALAYGAMRLRFRVMLARQAELRRHVNAATEQLRYDRLTGLLNRSEIESRLAAKLAAGSAAEEMIVALIDIDHFKRVNDCYGHLGGDDILRALGRLVGKAIWDGEYAGRYGGEEILLVLDDTDGRGAGRVLDLLAAIRGNPFNAAGRAVRITCSIGLAWAVSGDDWESLVGRADDALYEAKASGRNQVVERPRGVPVVRGAAGERRSRRTD